MPEFDAYLMVDWSASSRPARGSDSIWYCLLTRTDGRSTVAALENPATRTSAGGELREILRRLARRGQSVLVGFDSPYGYPYGFAASLRLDGMPPWRAVWREIANNIVDGADNTNNRFTAAADWNRRISDGCYPFWGCPASCVCSTLSSSKCSAGRLAERRLTDIGNMQPIWKLYGNGCVGSQALMGIPCVAGLRDDPVLAAVSCVWPFETCLRALPARRDRDWLILHAEIYPSLLSVKSAAGEVKDAAQVRMLAAHFAALDDGEGLSPLFAGPASLTPTDRERIEFEEGWTLGVGAKSCQQEQDVVPGRSFASPPVGGVASSSRPHRAGMGRSTEPGYENRNGQITMRYTALAGTDRGQYVYVLRCGSCGHEYGANGSDIHIRRCPACQGGRPGLHY
jgi:precorrin-8X/cobalt-precorrin-8 methylmutase